MTVKTHEYFGKCIEYELNNGLDVLLKPMNHVDSVTSYMWVRAGSLYETSETNGLSHFLEHMLFKGTAEYSRDEINRRVEEVGGTQNAATSKDYTNYYVKVPENHWKLSLRILQQMTLHACLPEDEFQKERNVVLSELARYEDSPHRKIWLKFIPKLYAGHPYGQLTIGSRSVLESVTYEQLRTYYNEFYLPSRMTLVVAGKFEISEGEKYVSQLFADEKKSTYTSIKFPDVNPPETTSVERIQTDVDQCYGLVGTTGVSIESRTSLALDVLMKLLGGSRSSQLYRNLVRDKQLASSISATFRTQRQSGPVKIRFQTQTESIDALLSGIKNQIKTIRSGEFSDEEFKRAKTLIETDKVYTSQTSAGQSRQLGYWHTIASVEYLESYLDRLSSVSRSDIIELAESVLAEQNWVGVIIEPESSRSLTESNIP